MNQQKGVFILEESNNPHFTTSNVVEVANLQSGRVLKAENSMLVEHGEHRTVATEPDTVHIIKITQQEFNPILKLIQDATD